jgi:hypothetical protein
MWYYARPPRAHAASVNTYRPPPQCPTAPKAEAMAGQPRVTVRDCAHEHVAVGKSVIKHWPSPLLSQPGESLSLSADIPLNVLNNCYDRMYL